MSSQLHGRRHLRLELVQREAGEASYPTEGYEQRSKDSQPKPREAGRPVVEVCANSDRAALEGKKLPTGERVRRNEDVHLAHPARPASIQKS